MENLTIIYYTSCNEQPEFEKKIIDNLLAVSGDIPIISVSRKPIDFGLNIYVGEQPICYSNEWKQLLIGLQNANTEFCIAAESDCLYPPDYFKFIPPVNNKVYRYGNVWAFWENRRKFWKKPKCEGAQICGTQFWIERLELMLGGDMGWQPMDNPARMVAGLFEEEDWYPYIGDPVITFKTKRNISNKTSLSKVPSRTTLPYWGDANELYKRMFL